MPPKSRSVLTGLDRIESLWPRDLKAARVGLVAHPASTNHNIQHAINIFLSSKKFRLTALFGPQHGILGQTQDNMVEWEGFRDTASRRAIYNL